MKVMGSTALGWAQQASSASNYGLGIHYSGAQGERRAGCKEEKPGGRSSHTLVQEEKPIMKQVSSLCTSQVHFSPVNQWFSTPSLLFPSEGTFYNI